MAEIEVLLDFGRPYVRLDDYNEMKERYWSQVTKTQDADGEAAKWQEHARAALARAEAAEAAETEAVDLHRQLAEMAAAMEEIEAERLALAARVAELEAQLASDAADENQWLDAYIESAAKDGATIKRLMARVAELESQLAAQQWRPIDEPAPKGEIEVKMRCAVTDDGGVYKIRTDIFVGWWTSADDSEWRPLPTAPQETEKPSWQKS